MNWNAGDWLQLVTAISVSAAAVLAWLLFRMARRRERVFAPAVVTTTFNPGLSGCDCLLRFGLKEPDQGRWSFTKVAVSLPKSARLGEPAVRRDRAGELVPVGLKGLERCVAFDPPRPESELVVSTEGSEFVTVEFHMALNADPRITSRFTTHIRMPA